MSYAALVLLLWLHGAHGAGTPTPALKATPPAPPPAVRHTWWKRDPFRPMVPPRPAGPPERPSGRAGLEVGRLRIVAIALGGPNGPVAMVANSRGHTYFLRSGDAIFDAQVIRLESNGIWFERTRVQKGASALVFRKIS